MYVRDLETGRSRAETSDEVAIRLAEAAIAANARAARNLDNSWLHRGPRRVLCVAAGTLCVVGATLPSPPTDSFASRPELLPYYPTTNQIAKAGSLAGALAANGVEIPIALCCGGSIPGRPVDLA